MSKVNSESPTYNLYTQEVTTDPLGEFHGRSIEDLSLVADLTIDEAKELVAEFGGLIPMAKASAQEIEARGNIPISKAVRIMAALDLARGLMAERTIDRDQIISPSDVYGVAAPVLMNKSRENFAVIMVDSQNRVIRTEVLYKGTKNSAAFNPGEIFRLAVIHDAAAIFLAHNHPSGDPKPSREDINATKGLIEAGKLLGVMVLDHIVVGESGFVSIRERGGIFGW